MAKAGADRELHMSFVQVYCADWPVPRTSAEYKRQSLLLFAYLHLINDGDIDEVRSMLPKKLHGEYDRYIVPKAAKVRQGYWNSVSGKARKARKGNSRDTREVRENASRSTQENSRSTQEFSSEETHTQLPADSSNLGSTLFDSNRVEAKRSKYEAEAIRRQSANALTANADAPRSAEGDEDHDGAPLVQRDYERYPDMVGGEGASDDYVSTMADNFDRLMRNPPTLPGAVPPVLPKVPCDDLRRAIDAQRGKAAKAQGYHWGKDESIVLERLGEVIEEIIAKGEVPTVDNCVPPLDQFCLQNEIRQQVLMPNDLSEDMRKAIEDGARRAQSAESKRKAVEYMASDDCPEYDGDSGSDEQ